MLTQLTACACVFIDPSGKLAAGVNVDTDGNGNLNTGIVESLGYISWFMKKPEVKIPFVNRDLGLVYH
jgi:hypothetical protein